MAVADVEGFLSDLVLSNHREKTVNDYRSLLSNFFGFCGRVDAASVTVDDMREFLKKNKPVWTNNTYCTYVVKLKSFFRDRNLAVSVWMRQNMKAHPNQVDIVPLSRQNLLDMARFFGTRLQKKGFHIEETWEAVHWFLAATGCRVGELCKLNIGDVINDNKEMCFRIHFKAGNTKTGKQRNTYIPLGSIAGVSLRSYLLKHRSCAGVDDPLFLNARRHRFIPELIQAKYRDVKKALGIKSKCTPHVLRHTYCTFLQEKGVDPRAASELTGHSVLTYLSVYGHPTEKRKQQITKTYQIV